MKIPTPKEIEDLLRNPSLFIAPITQSAVENSAGTIRHPFKGNVRAIAIGGDLQGGQVPVYEFNGQFLALGTPTTQVGETRHGEGFLSANAIADDVVEEAGSRIKFIYLDSSDTGLNELWVFDGSSYVSLGLALPIDGSISNMGLQPNQWNGWASFEGSVLPYQNGMSLTESNIEQPLLLSIGQGWGVSFPFGENSQDPVTAHVTQSVLQSSLSSEGIVLEASGQLRTEFLTSGYPNWSQNTDSFVQEGATESFNMTANNDARRSESETGGPYDDEYPYCPNGPDGIRIHIAIPLTDGHPPAQGPNSPKDWYRGLKHYNYTPGLNLVHTSVLEFVPGNTDDQSPWLSWNIVGANHRGVSPADPDHPNYNRSAGELLPCGFSLENWTDPAAPFTVSGDIRLYSRTYRLHVEDWGGEFVNQFTQTYQSFNPCSSEVCMLRYLDQFEAYETASGPLTDHVWIVEYEGEIIATNHQGYCGGGGFSCPIEWGGPAPSPELANVPNYLWQQILLRSFENNSIQVDYVGETIELPEESSYLFLEKVKYFLNEVEFKNETPLVARVDLR